jgi:hypothetical protein
LLALVAGIHVLLAATQQARREGVTSNEAAASAGPAVISGIAGPGAFFERRRAYRR